MSEEEKALQEVYAELSKDNPDPLAIPPMLNNKSLDLDELSDIIDTWSDEMKDKYHKAVIAVQEWNAFIQECEELGI